MSVSLVIKPYGFVGWYQCFGRLYCHYLQGWQLRHYVSVKCWRVLACPHSIKTQESNISMELYCLNKFEIVRVLWNKIFTWLRNSVGNVSFRLTFNNVSLRHWFCILDTKTGVSFVQWFLHLVLSSFLMFIIVK